MDISGKPTCAKHDFLLPVFKCGLSYKSYKKVREPNHSCRNATSLIIIIKISNEISIQPFNKFSPKPDKTFFGQDTDRMANLPVVVYLVLVTAYLSTSTSPISELQNTTVCGLPSSPEKQVPARIDEDHPAIWQRGRLAMPA